MSTRIYRTDDAPPEAITAARHIGGNEYEAPDQHTADILCRLCKEWSRTPTGASKEPPPPPQPDPAAVEEGLAEEE